MKSKRFAFGALVTVAVLALAVEPVAAQSTTANLINQLNNKLLYVAVPITILVEGVLFYAVWKFRDTEPKPTKENRRLEITWTVATAIILVFVGVASYTVLGSPYIAPQQGQNPAKTAPQDAVVVNVTAYQWGWDFKYPREGNISGATGQSGPVLEIPKGKSVYIRLHSKDVLHSFGVPKLGLKQDVFPGKVTNLETKVHKTGTYQGYCMEFCGAGHSQMDFQIKVVSQQQYDKWVQQQKQAKQSSSSGNSSASGNSSGNASASGNSSGNASTSTSAANASTGNQSSLNAAPALEAVASGSY